MSKKVLITGASGFIGRHCILPLVEKGYDVHCVSTHAQADENYNVVWHIANLLESAEINKLVKEVKPNYLLHLAWYVEPGKVIDSLQNLLWVERTLELFRTFYENGGKRITVSGSCYEYDWNHGYCSEDFTPTTPNSLYGVSKNSLNQMFTHFLRVSGVSGAWGRIFFLYGPHENKNRLVSSVICSLLSNEKAKSSHGKQIRDYMHAQDVANGLVTLLDSDLQGNFNIASGQPISLKQIIETIGKLMNKTELLDIGAIPARSNDTPLVIGDPRKFHELTGWNPEYNLELGLENTINWWKNNL